LAYLKKAEDLKQAAKTAVKRIYGEAMDNSSPDAAAFNRLFNTRLGRTSLWVKVERSFAQPNKGDYSGKNRGLITGKQVPASRT